MKTTVSWWFLLWVLNCWFFGGQLSLTVDKLDCLVKRLLCFTSRSQWRFWTSVNLCPDQSNIVWWCIIISQSIIQKYHFGMFKVKLKAEMLKLLQSKLVWWYIITGQGKTPWKDFLAFTQGVRQRIWIGWLWTRDVKLSFPKIHSLNFYPLCHSFDQFSWEWPIYKSCCHNPIHNFKSHDWCPYCAALAALQLMWHLKILYNVIQQIKTSNTITLSQSKTKNCDLWSLLLRPHVWPPSFFFSIATNALYPSQLVFITLRGRWCQVLLGLCFCPECRVLMKTVFDNTQEVLHI